MRIIVTLIYASLSCAKKSDTASSTSSSSASVSTYLLGFAVDSILSSTTSARVMSVKGNHSIFAFIAEASPAAKAATSVQLPSGDLGIWTATNGSNSEACAAAKLTSLINSATA